MNGGYYVWDITDETERKAVRNATTHQFRICIGKNGQFYLPADAAVDVTYYGRFKVLREMDSK